MPIYEYQCTVCGDRSDILHGINESGPRFCPACGAEGKMRKAFTAPAIVFKGSGWAKKDRRPTPAASKSKSTSAEGSGGEKSKTDTGSTSTSAPTSTSDSSKSSSPTAGPAPSRSSDD